MLRLHRFLVPLFSKTQLLPHQKHLAIGISGEIRTRITRFKSSQQTGESYFPRIESVRDSLGSVWTYGMAPRISTEMNVFPGDTIDFVITASDPFDEPLLYNCHIFGNSVSHLLQNEGWSENGSISITFNESDIGLNRRITCQIKSRRPFHAEHGMGLPYDDAVAFISNVLPLRIERNKNDR